MIRRKKESPADKASRLGVRLSKMQELQMLYHRNFDDADIIIGVDEETGNEFVAVGAEVLDQIANLPNDESRHVGVVRINIIQRTDELEALLGTIQTARSYHDYAPSRTTLADAIENRRREFDRLLEL